MRTEPKVGDIVTHLNFKGQGIVVEEYGDGSYVYVKDGNDRRHLLPKHELTVTLSYKCIRTTLTVRGKKAKIKLEQRLREEGTKFSIKKHGSNYKIRPKCKGR